MGQLLSHRVCTTATSSKSAQTAGKLTPYLFREQIPY